jgi:hypothetical protein
MRVLFVILKSPLDVAETVLQVQDETADEKDKLEWQTLREEAKVGNVADRSWSTHTMTMYGKGAQTQPGRPATPSGLTTMSWQQETMVTGGVGKYAEDIPGMSFQKSVHGSEVGHIEISVSLNQFQGLYPV